MKFRILLDAVRVNLRISMYMHFRMDLVDAWDPNAESLRGQIPNFVLTIAACICRRLLIFISLLFTSWVCWNCWKIFCIITKVHANVVGDNRPGSNVLCFSVKCTNLYYNVCWQARLRALLPQRVMEFWRQMPRSEAQALESLITIEERIQSIMVGDVFSKLEFKSRA